MHEQAAVRSEDDREISRPVQAPRGDANDGPAGEPGRHTIAADPEAQRGVGSDLAQHVRGAKGDLGHGRENASGVGAWAWLLSRGLGCRLISGSRAGPRDTAVSHVASASGTGVSTIGYGQAWVATRTEDWGSRMKSSSAFGIGSVLAAPEQVWAIGGPGAATRRGHRLFHRLPFSLARPRVS
jgi:hypothetical protein